MAVTQAGDVRAVAGSGRSARWARGIFIANLVAQCAIIVTGAVVRLTGSGLGCPTWPECVEGSYIPTATQEQGFHKYIEFGNRLLTFALVVLAIAAIVAAVADASTRRRRPLVLLAAIPIVGTVAQAVLGGITVLTGLSPLTVSAHFLVSMGIVAGCVALVARSRDLGDGPPVWTVPRDARLLTWAIVIVTAIVVVLGVIVTGSGPHSGDANAEHRFSFDPRTVAWLHADVVLLFLGLAVGLALLLRAIKAPTQARRAIAIVLVVALAQALVGYVQYWTGLPIVLVALHVVGACALWVAVLWLPFTQRTRA